METPAPKMYHLLAPWWPLLSPVEDYAEEAAFFAGLMREHAAREVREVLELGCGGGHNAVHLKRDFELTLTDLSEEMLAVSRALNPECAHVQGDMRALRLGRDFDAVFVHDAVCYMATEADLRAAMGTSAAHLRPGGVAVFAPDETEESFMEQTVHGGSDDGVHGIRYLEWTHDPDPADGQYTADYAYLLRHADGRAEALHDRHVCGLFPVAKWLEWLGLAGFSAFHLRDAWGRDIFIGQMPHN